MYSLSEKSCMKGKILVVINQIQLRLQTDCCVHSGEMDTF